MKPFKSLSLLMVPMMFLFMLFFNACEEDTKEKIVEVIVNDTLIAVTVTSIDASPDMIAQGGTVTFTATTTKLSNVGDLTKYWFATGGTLNAAEGDTVQWKAPDDAGTYVISVHATDGTFIGTGKMNVGVDMYAATADTFFVGADACSGCHATTHTGWAATGHAGAWASLQTSDHAASYCNPCHTVDFDQTPGNAGYDDAPIAKFENVQCENCHGPASIHPAEGNPVVDISDGNCTGCHSGDHHPFASDWEGSGHNFGPDAAHGAPTRAGSCDACHSGNGFIANNDPDFEWDGEAVGVVCAACHDPHNVTNEHQLRTLAPYESVVANGTTTSIEVTGNGQLCVQCHHARRSADTQIDEGYGHFGPHGSPQGDMIAGVSGYEDLNGFDFSGGFKTGHYLIEDACVTCHMHVEPYPNADTGHSFEPTVAACKACHGTLNTFDDIMALEDFDGDGTTEGVQTEVKGLLNFISQGLVDAGLDTTGGGEDLWEAVVHGLEITEDDTLADGTQKPENIFFREVGYNVVYVINDGSFGVHNPDYAIQMLQQAYIHLQAGPGGEAVREKFNGAVLSAHQKAVNF